MAEEVNVIIKVDNSDGTKKIETIDKAVDKTKKNLKEADKGSTKFSKGLKGWGTALKASGILLLIGAIVKILNTAKEAVMANADIAQRWSDVSAGISAVYARIATDVVDGAKEMAKEFNENGGFLGLLNRIGDSEWAKKVKKGFESPQAAIKTIGKLLKDFFINRLNGIIDSVKALGSAFKHLREREFKKLGEDFKNVGQGMAQAVIGVEKPFDKVIEKTKDAWKESEEYRNKLQAVKDEAERINKAFRDHLVTVAESGQKIADINSKIIEQKKIADDVNKLEAERITALDEIIKLEQDSINLKIKDAEIQLQLMEDAGELATNTQEENAALIKQQTIITNLQNQADQKKLTAEKKKGSLIKKNLSDELKSEQLLEDLKNDNIKNEQARAFAQLETERERQLIELEDYENSKELKLEIDKKYESDKAAIEDEFATAAAEKKNDENQKTIDDNQNIINEQVSDLNEMQVASDTIFSALSTFKQILMDKELKAAEGNEKAQNVIRKKFAKEEQDRAVTQVIIDGILAIAKTFATLGWPAGIAGAIIAGVATAGQIATIKSQKFANGGKVSGPGTGTSDSISARLSNGESVINARSTSMFSDQLSAMNVAGGGVAFARGGIAGQTGSVVPDSNISDDIINKIAKIPVVVSAVEISNVQRSVEVAETDSIL